MKKPNKTTAQIERDKRKREKIKAIRQARKKRERLRIEKRKAKRAIKAAPRNALYEWAHDPTEPDVCAVCGVGVVAKVNKDGTPKMVRKKIDGKWIITNRQVMVPLNCHHILPKERYAQFKTHKMNRIRLCPQHHKISKWSAHRNPIWFSDWLSRNRPDQYEWAIDNMGIDPSELRK